MRNFLRYDGPLGRFLNSVADMVLLNLLWLLCSLPVGYHWRVHRGTVYGHSAIPGR